MRTKNAKRLWPVPATLAVMAVAAFLAFGLMATTGAQPAAAQQSDPCVTVDQGGTADPTSGTCQVTSSEGIIKLTNNDRAEKKMFHVFGANVGSAEPEVYPPGTVYDSTTDNRFEDTADEEAEPIRYMPVEVPAAGPGGPASMTVTVPGEPLGEQMVWVFTSDDFNYGAITGAPSEASIKQMLPSGSRALTIEYLGPPVLTAPDTGEAPNPLLGDCESDDYDADSADADRKPDKRSEIEIAALVNGRIAVTEHIVTVTVMDAHCRPLEGKITYSVEYVAGTALQSGRNDYTTQPADYVDAVQDDDDEGTRHPVSGWETSGPVFVNVNATFTGGTGSLTLEADPLKRAGKLDDINVMATCYTPDLDAEEEKATTAQVKICGTNDMGTPNDVADDVGMRPRTVFMVGQDFTVKADAVDMLGTTTNTRLSVEYPDIKTDKGLAALSGPATFMSSLTSDDALDVMIHDEAPPGRYMLTVKAREGSGSTRIDKEATVEIIVSGEVYEYEIIGPENIALASFSSAEYTVKATDMQGNPPNFKEGEDMVLVVIESDHSLRVTGLEDNMVMLDHETGTDTFTVYKPAGAQRGDIASIGIFVDDELQDSTMVSFGDAIMMPGMPMNVMAEATSHDMITVSWASPADDGGSDITGYMVQRGYMDADNMMMWMDVDPAHMGMDMMYMDMGLMAETTYYYRVAAMNSIGMGEYSDGMAMAMTMMMPPMELGAPSITSVMSDAEGMATVMLMPGDNATKHYIWAQPTDLSQGMYSDEAGGDADMVTISGLTSGMNYWFIAIAGRGTGTDSEWSAWSGWTAETPIQ